MITVGSLIRNDPAKSSVDRIIFLILETTIAKKLFEFVLRSLQLRGKSGDMKNLSQREFIWILPFSLSLGAVLSSLQAGNWLFGWLGFSFPFLLSLSLLTLSTKWAGGGKTLAWMVILAFALRFVGGVATYLALPVYGAALTYLHSAKELVGQQARWLDFIE